MWTMSISWLSYVVDFEENLFEGFDKNAPDYSSYSPSLFYSPPNTYACIQACKTITHLLTPTTAKHQTRLVLRASHILFTLPSLV